MCHRRGPKTQQERGEEHVGQGLAGATGEQRPAVPTVKGPQLGQALHGVAGQNTQRSPGLPG